MTFTSRWQTGRPLPKSFDYSTVIDAENIGAIPLLPGEEGCGALKKFIAGILGRKTADAHLGVNGDGFQNVIPTRGTTVVVAPDETAYLERDVVYGTYHSGQLEWIKEKRLYNMPVEKAVEIGIADENAAKAKTMLFLVSGTQGHKAKPSVFHIKRGSAKKIKQGDLVSHHGYVPRKSEPGKEYWLWELEG